MIRYLNGWKEWKIGATKKIETKKTNKFLGREAEKTEVRPRAATANAVGEEGELFLTYRRHRVAEELSEAVAEGWGRVYTAQAVCGTKIE